MFLYNKHLWKGRQGKNPADQRDASFMMEAESAEHYTLRLNRAVVLIYSRWQPVTHSRKWRCAGSRLLWPERELPATNEQGLQGLQHPAIPSSFENGLCQQFFPGSSDSKESPCDAGDMGLIPGLGRSPGEGHGNPLPYSCLVNPMDRGAWRATVHGVANSWTRLSD